MPEKLTIRQLRGLREMSQEQLSKLTNITTRTISSYENDISALRKASYEDIEKIATALNVSVDNIFLSAKSEKPKYSL